MITIFCDFRQFSAKKLAFFSKTNVVINFLHYSALFLVKNANVFANCFGENLFKIITSVPGHSAFIVIETRVARWFVFKPKNPNLGKFGRAFEWKMLVFVMVIW
jgi:hypothetical protein